MLFVVGKMIMINGGAGRESKGKGQGKGCLLDLLFSQVTCRYLSI
jgi:hypothetical protein